MSNLSFLNEGESISVKGSGKKPYEVKKVGGVVSCSCPAWRNIGGRIDTRVCKHIRVNVDPACLLPQALASNAWAGVSIPGVVNPTAGLVGTPMVLNGQTVTVYHDTTCRQVPRLTKTGKVSTAVGGAVVKDTAPPLLLAHKWDGVQDPKGWWISEKLDGVRAWWDGEKFVSRLGNTYHAPEWFVEGLPTDVILDGELWVGRGLFQKTISAVRKLVPTDAEWKKVKFMIFDGGWSDAKDISSHTTTFEERQDWLLENIVETSSVKIVKQRKCKGIDHLKKELTKVEALGAEGLMLREPGSLYEEGRSNTCLKVKSFIDDEAIIMGYTLGKGKHKGRVGAFEVAWNGEEFEIGTGLKDKDRISPPSLGSRITFRYFELTDAGIPRFPVFIAARNYE